MNLDYLREKKELVVNSEFAAYFKSQSLSVLLLCVSAILVILILVKVSGFFAVTARAETLVKQAIANGKPDDKETEKHLAKFREVADELKKKNLFAPPPPKQHPVKEVSGIMGDEVLINGKWYKAGDMVADAKIVAIEPARVRIEWDGNEKVFLPIDATIPAGPKGPKPKPDDEVTKADKGEAATMVHVQLEVRGGEGMFSEEDMERFRGMRERWENMSEEEREQYRARMRERSGGRHPPGEGRRGRRRE